MLNHKVLIIGLDGATWRVLRPLLVEGGLLNLRHILKQGVSGTLVSTFPPVTAPAWVSFMTGVYPGKHGVFDFRLPLDQNCQRRPIHSRMIASPTIWQLLSDHGTRVGAANVPITYPPSRVNGFMVTGMLSPKFGPDMFYPTELYQSVVGAVGEWLIEVRWMDYDTEASLENFLSALNSSLDKRLRLAKHLMCTEDWDCFMVVFQETDFLQHRLWHLIDAEHVQYDAKYAEFYKPLVRQLYERVDTAIEELVSTVDDNTFIILMSDHGFGPLNYRVDLVTLLSNAGLLKSNIDQARARVEECFRRIDVFKLRRLISTDVRRKLGTDMYSSIDWPNTLAYPGTDTEQGVYVNLSGREPFGVVSSEQYDAVCEQIVDALRSAINPNTAEPLFSWVCRRSEVYFGPFVERAPDVVFGFATGGYALQRDYFRRRELSEAAMLVRPAGMETGYHRSDGIFVIMGDQIVRGHNLDARIVDLAPTVLYMLGCPVPSQMDGQVLTDAFRPGFVERFPPIFDTPARADQPMTAAERVYSDQDIVEIEKRLRSLGYL